MLLHVHIQTVFLKMKLDVICRFDDRTQLLQHKSSKEDSVTLGYALSHSLTILQVEKIGQEEESYTEHIIPFEVLINAFRVRDYPFHLAEIPYICTFSPTVVNIVFVSGYQLQNWKEW